LVVFAALALFVHSKISHHGSQFWVSMSL